MKKKAKKFFRWLGIVASSLVVLAAGAVVLIYQAAERELAKRYTVNETMSMLRPTDTNEVAEGRRLARLTGCTHCHGENLGGAVPFDIPNVVRIVAPDLTAILPQYSDAQLVGLLRRGVKRDGSGTWFMPAQMHRHLHDEDLTRIIAWIRLMPITEGVTGQTQLRPIGRLMVAKGEIRSSAEEILRLDRAGDARVPPGRGAYLVMNLCSECHGQNLEGRPEALAAPAPALAVVKAYSLEAFAQLMHDGTGAGGRTSELMTQAALARFTYLTADEVAAMYEFLRTRG